MATLTPMEEAMRRKRTTYRDLGFLTGKDPGYLCRIAKGRQRPSRPTALAIGKALGIDPNLILRNEEAA